MVPVMRIELLAGQDEDLTVDIVGARQIIFEDTHIGALIETEDESYILPPLVHDRRSFPMTEIRWALGKHDHGSVPIFDTLEDGPFEAIQGVLDLVADRMGVPVRRA